MTKTMRLLLSVTVLLGVTAAGARAQVPAAPKELGMGGAYLGIARGYESIFLNPANLAVPGRPSWSLAFPQVAVGGTLLGPDVRDLRDLAQFQELPGTRQEELLGLIPGRGTGGGFSLRAPLVALSVGGVGLGVAYASTGSHTVSRDLAELFLRGYEDGRTAYSVGNTGGERATYWDLALAYGRAVGPVSLGATAHYVRGGSLVRTKLFEPRVNLEAQDVQVDYVGVLARGGSGYALDVGAAYLPLPTLTVSAGLSNAFSRMTWSDDLRVRQITFDRQMIENATPRDLMNRYQYSEKPLDPGAVSLRVYDTAEGIYDEAYFPTVGRLGLAWSPLGRTRLSADVHRKLTNGRLGDPWDQRVAVGIQQSLSLISVRGGYSVGNDGGNMLGSGLSIGPLDLGVARYQHSSVRGDAQRGWMATLGLGVME
jgi:hypothetical protein